MELIMIDAAIAHGPQNMTTPVCLECCAPVDGSYVCGMCNMPMCGEACQVGPTHYMECQILRTLKQKISVKDFEVNLFLWFPIFLIELLSNRKKSHQFINA